MLCIVRQQFSIINLAQLANPNLLRARVPFHPVSQPLIQVKQQRK
jgi:hypothetical protein